MRMGLILLLLIFLNTSAFSEIEIVWHGEEGEILTKIPSAEQITKRSINPSLKFIEKAIQFYDEGGNVVNNLSLPLDQKLQFTPHGTLFQSYNNEAEEFELFSLEGDFLFSFPYSSNGGNLFYYPITSPYNNCPIVIFIEKLEEGYDCRTPQKLYFYNFKGELLSTYQFPGEVNPHNSITFSKDGKNIAVLGLGHFVLFDSNCTILWKQNIAKVCGYSNNKSIRFSSNGEYILISGNDRTSLFPKPVIYCFDISGNLLWSKKDISFDERFAEFSFDTDYVILWHNQKSTATFFSVITGEEIFSLNLEEKSAKNLSDFYAELNIFTIPNYLAIVKSNYGDPDFTPSVTIASIDITTKELDSFYLEIPSYGCCFCFPILIDAESKLMGINGKRESYLLKLGE